MKASQHLQHRGSAKSLAAVPEPAAGAMTGGRRLAAAQPTSGGISRAFRFLLQLLRDIIKVVARIDRRSFNQQ